MSPLGPYAALGLRGNPFLAGTPAEIPDDFWVDRGRSAPPTAGARCLVQVIGVRGAGKSAHLRRWRDLTGGPLRHVPTGWRRWRPLPVAPIAYWDEADRAPRAVLRAALRRAARGGATVVVGTHADLGPAARSAGLRVTTWTLPVLDSATLIAWAGPRIEAARLERSGAVGLSLGTDTAARIASACGASLREAATRLHVWAAERAAAATGLAPEPPAVVSEASERA